MSRFWQQNRAAASAVRNDLLYIFTYVIIQQVVAFQQCFNVAIARMPANIAVDTINGRFISLHG